MKTMFVQVNTYILRGSYYGAFLREINSLYACIAFLMPPAMMLKDWIKIACNFLADSYPKNNYSRL